jgi:hypothetical protein
LFLLYGEKELVGNNMAMAARFGKSLDPQVPGLARFSPPPRCAPPSLLARCIENVGAQEDMRYQLLPPSQIIRHFKNLRELKDLKFDQIYMIR